MAFTILAFEAYINSPHANISIRFEAENVSFESSSGIYEDIELDGTSFSGSVNSGFENVNYTILFDNIEFSETETHFIFYKGTIRFGYYDSVTD
ncbi:MAG: hypothetical protein WA749_08590 [Gelidibacter sp.]